MNPVLPHFSANRASRGGVIRAFVSAGAAIGAMVPAQVSAQTQAYDSAHGSNVWDTSTANWDAGSVWTNGNSAVFGGTGETVDLEAAITAAGISFTSDGYTLADGNGNASLVFSPNAVISVADAGHSATISENFVVDGSGFTKTGAGRLTLTGSILTGGGVSVQEGTLVLGRGGSFPASAVATGQFSSPTVITVEAGATLSASGTWAFGGGLGNQVVVNGGVLNFANDNYLGNLVLNGATVTSSGGSHPWRTGNWASGRITTLANANSSVVSSNLTFVGATAAPTTTFDVADGAAAVDLQFNGNIYDHPGYEGRMKLVKTGDGTMNLSGGKSWSGGTVLSQGTLQAASTAALGTGAITINDADTGAHDTSLLATGAITLANNIVVTADGTGTVKIGTTDFNPGAVGTFFSGTMNLNRATTLTAGNTDRTTYLGVISGNVGTLTVTGGARTTMEAQNTFVGDVRVTGAGTILQVGRSNGTTNQTQIGSANALIVDSDASFYTNLGNGGSVLAGSLAGAGRVQLHPGVTGTQTLIVGSDNTSTTFSGVIANGGGTFALTKTGLGTLTLSGSNSYTGTTNVQGGTIKIGSMNALGGYISGRPVTQVVVASGGAVDFNGVVDATYGYTIAGTGVGGTGALTNSGGGIGNGYAQTSNIRLSADASIGGTGNWALLTNGYGATTLDLNGHTLTKTGSNTFTLVNSTITAGGINIASGVLTQFRNGHNASQASVTLADTAGAALNLNNLNFSAGSLAGGGTSGGNVNLGSGTLTTGALNTSTTYAGVISGSGGLVKTGTGALTLTGASTYQGTTTVAGGSLIVNNTSGSATGSGAVIVQNGGLLGGSGQITTLSGVTIQSGGTLAVGNSPGTLTINGNLTLEANSIFGVDMVNPTSDLVVVNGSTSLGGVIEGTWGGGVNNQFQGTYSADNMNWLIDSEGPLSGTFSNSTLAPSFADLFEGVTPYITEIGGQMFAMFYNAQMGVYSQAGLTGGNDLLLMAIPEPGSTMLVALSGASLLLRRRRSI